MNKAGSPIVYYRLPDEKKVGVIQSETFPLEVDSLTNIAEKAGFIFVPFSSTSSAKPYFIQADKHISMSPDEIGKMPLDDYQFSEPLMVNPKNKAAYCGIVEDAVKNIQSGICRKIVLSRLKKINTNSQNPLKIFHKLCVKYPAAFVSLVYIPGMVVWITATPELLVSAEGNIVKTVSLAGTKPVDSKEAWSAKEKDEQQVVTDYIHDILKKHCDTINISGPNEVVAGNVKHLKTAFSAILNSGIWNLVSGLHPTPAVCGIPTDRAQEFIELTEDYDRKYYTGFLGLCNIEGKTNLFVNLRCAEMLHNSVNLYIGGGITKDSIPEKEWDETELKSKTLLFAFEEDEKK